MPNIRKLALPMWKTLNLNSIQEAFSKWKNLQTLTIAPLISLGDTLSLELQAIGDNCRNLTNIKFLYRLDKDLASMIVCSFPSLERLSFRCSYACVDAAISLINGLPNLKIFNLSHCIFTQPNKIRNKIDDNRVSVQPNGVVGKTFRVLGMKPEEELVQTGTKKLVRFMVCASDCTICQDVWEHFGLYNPDRQTLELRYFREEQWKTDEIKEFEF
ncbi:unnamed protein product [Microthlaspi erraticum]|uniref:FBD domain-containing protein n=1 Tax=Microthlaspi erraticum TaxID=1685480 RepID=A0A6D2JR05_9BRAS|nr:unnamed protein product [Microthlaspi erraticum]